MGTKNYKLFSLFLLLLIGVKGYGQSSYTAIKLFDEVVFYDGYNGTIFDKDLNDGILRHSNSLYAVKLTPEQLSQFGDSVVMNVWIKACCDNYDRIGNINLALVPKESSTYNPDEVKRMELGRFITPFMDKNKEPDVVPYTYRTDYLSYIFRDKTLTGEYDLWVEFELFGIPYAANEQIKGCKDRNDVFFGTLEFATSLPAESSTDKNVLVPIVMKKNETKGNNLNNYNEQATDTLGKTVKNYVFNVPVDVTDGQIVLITSNHGANNNGEEYNRRWHYVYLDNELLLTYKPGRTSCEPFRKYNTQSNGIYGWKVKTDQAWQSFSNWCPGDVIDNRIINLGACRAGEHILKISVPEAKFAGNQGDIPVSAFFQGLTEGTLPSAIESEEFKPYIRLSYNNERIDFNSEETVVEVTLYNVQGRCLYSSENNRPVYISSYPSGIYLLNVELANGVIETHKIVKN